MPEEEASVKEPSWFEIGIKNVKATIATIAVLMSALFGAWTWATDTFMLRADEPKYVKKEDLKLIAEKQEQLEANQSRYATKEAVQNIREATSNIQLYVMQKSMEDLEKAGRKDSPEYRSLHIRRFKIMKDLGIIDEDTPYKEPQ